MDLFICKVCEKKKVRKFVGFFPKGNNKKYEDSCGNLWTGKKCPDCKREESAVRMKELRSRTDYQSKRYIRYGTNEYNIEYSKKYYQENKSLLKKKREAKYYKVREQSARRRAKQKQATPGWLTFSQILEIQNVYKGCPKGYHVDHIIPLNGVNVTGLHVPWNLQYLPASVNISKGNRLV